MLALDMKSIDATNSVREEFDIGFYGKSHDQRGEKSIEVCEGMSRLGLKVTYENDDEGCLYINDCKVQCHEIEDFFSGRKITSVLLESTTLGVPEIALLLNYFVSIDGIKIRIIYLEPERYSPKVAEKALSRDFDLSDMLSGYQGIPTLARELDTSAVNKVVFFVGFESGRLMRAFEEQPISEGHSSLVFGVPPYKAGWENNSYHNNIKCLRDRDLRNRLFYCAADNPQSVIDKLTEIKSSMSEDDELFVAPIGSKPHSIGALFFQAMNSEDVGLLYDHPVKTKGRSTGFGKMHCFDVVEKA